MTVVTVGSGLKVAVIWSVMFILTLVQSRTHVDTVQTVLHITTNSRHICWSHTMKALGSHVTFVRRNLAAVVTLRSTYFVMKVWSCLFAVTVQRVSVQDLNWNLISWNTRTINSFAVVHVVNISNIKKMLSDTSTDVLLNWDMWMSSRGKIETENKQSVDNCLLDRVANVDSRLVSEILCTAFLFCCTHPDLLMCFQQLSEAFWILYDDDDDDDDDEVCCGFRWLQLLVFLSTWSF